MHRRWVASHIIALGVLLFLINAASAAQVITDDIQQWARQAVEREASLEFKPAANTVAVLYFQNRTQQPAFDFLEKGMAVLLITDLAKLPEIEVVERTHLQALMQEMKMGASGLVAKETAPRAGRLLGAHYLVGGIFNTTSQEAFNIESELLDVPRNGIVGSPSGAGSLETLLRLEKEILFELVRLLKLELTEAQREALRKPVTSDIKALKFLVEGLDNSDQGNYEKAADSYRAALDIDPNLKPALSAIDELVTRGLIRPQARNDVLLRDLREQVSVNRGPTPNPITKRHRSEPASPLGPGGSNTGDVRVEW